MTNLPRAVAAGVQKPKARSRGSWALAGSECYGELMLAPISMMAGRRHDASWMSARTRGWESAVAFRRALGAGQRAIGGWWM